MNVGVAGKRTDVQICVELFHFGLPYNFLKLPKSWHLTPIFFYTAHAAGMAVTMMTIVI